MEYREIENRQGPILNVLLLVCYIAWGNGDLGERERERERERDASRNKHQCAAIVLICPLLRMSENLLRGSLGLEHEIMLTRKPSQRCGRGL